MSRKKSSCADCRNFHKDPDELPCSWCEYNASGFEINEKGWIPCSKRLPNEQEIEASYKPYFGSEFLVTIEGAGLAATLLFKDGVWTDDDGNWYSVVAWMPLPEPWEVE